MHETPRLSIILPVYNERESLGIMIKILEATLDFSHEVLVVFDDTEDNTIEIANNLIKTFPNIKLVHNDLGPGAHLAVKKGIDMSVSDTILITTVDEVFPIIAIHEMLELVEDYGCGLVSGTRYALGGKRYGGSLVGGILSRIANHAFRMITGFPLSDGTTGIKMIRKSILEDIDIESKSKGWAFAFELSLKAGFSGVKLGEIPLKSIDRLFGGQSTFKLGPSFKEYFRWFIWGTMRLNRNNRTHNKAVTLKKYINI